MTLNERGYGIKSIIGINFGKRENAENRPKYPVSEYQEFGKFWVLISGTGRNALQMSRCCIAMETP